MMHSLPPAPLYPERPLPPDALALSLQLPLKCADGPMTLARTATGLPYLQSATAQTLCPTP